MDIEPIARSAAQASADELLAEMCREIEREVMQLNTASSTKRRALMGRATFVVAGAAAVTCFAAAAAYWWMKVLPLNLVEQDVAGALIDPSSAQFRDVNLSASTGGACGWVNAKNRMGGYVGYTQFVRTKAGVVTFRPSGEPVVPDREDGTLRSNVELLNFIDHMRAQCPGHSLGE